MSKANPGNFLEDLETGQVLHHATPRTVSTGDVALYTSLFPTRFALQSSHEFARTIGYVQAPIDDLLVFHFIFGKTVPDISLNAVANLGYADCRFLKPVFPGDTLSASSKIIGVRENSSGKTGIIYVRSTGRNQDNDIVLDFVRWVMVRKRCEEGPVPEAKPPFLPDAVDSTQLVTPPRTDFSGTNTQLSGSPCFWDDYHIGEKIDHVDGVTIEEAEHMMAARLFQNTAKVHFDQHTQGQSPPGRRIIYGGHVISMARALTFNGLGNAFLIGAINAGHHIAPCFGGDTVFAWTEITDKKKIPGRKDLATLRLRTLATKNRPCSDFPHLEGQKYAQGVVLELDYWVLIPIT